MIIIIIIINVLYLLCSIPMKYFFVILTNTTHGNCYKDTVLDCQA